ncbi:MAG: gliding motility-associated C-terminal domain-containing protein [Flavobacteriales bacterium]|nr:gliding motility-associated C-terminal domain-containing protein [Flavobacteriales bacterium]
MPFRFILSFLFLTTYTLTTAQTTLNCLEVENILVDACSPDLKEGQNEMVRILVGPNNLNVNSIVPVWPNHAFGGWIMNGITAQNTAVLNASITSCGYLLEPLGGIIPANKKAILVTSWDMNTAANSFAGLSDTLYILYQNTQRGNAGHFANAGTGLRTLTINYAPLSCSETVTYDRSLLVGGDGAFVNFNQAGNASYGNNGCTAPIQPFTIDAGANPASVCAGSPATLQGSVVGSFSYIQWTGGTGTFSAAGNLSGTYTPSSGETGSFWVYLNVKGACPDTLRDSVLITITPQPSVQITQQNATICQGNSTTINATANGPVAWSTLQTGNAITVNAPGQYVAFTTNACGVASDTIVVTSSPLASVQITENDFSICSGNTAVISATGSGTINWSTGQTGNSINISSGGTYTATVTNNCGSVTDNITITEISAPSVVINETNFALCAGASATLTTTASGTVTWSTGQTGNSISVNTGGLYIATVTNTCGNAADSIQISTASQPSVQITQNNAAICEGETFVIQATGSGTINWSTGQTGNSITVNDGGTFTATVTNSCGTVSDSIQITQNPLPFVNIQPVNPVICNATGIQLTADANAPVSWNGNAPSASFTVNNAQTVVAIASNSCGTASDTVVVSEGILPQAQISGPSIVSICTGSSYALSGSGNGTLIWSNQSTGNAITVTNSGVYFLISQTECGTDTAFVNVSVSSPDASFTANPPTGNIPLTVQTANQSTGAQTYLWSSGNGEVSDAFSPSFDYNVPGEFTLGLWITDANGCMDSAFTQILVYESMEVFLPNVFTPNGDLVNDEYFAVVKGVSDFRMFIFNRWGERVFESVSPDLHWDGTAPFGNEAVDGVYFCTVIVKDYYGKSHEFSSSVTLVR